MLLYLAGPYTTGDVDHNIQVARKIACEVWEKPDLYAITPHLNTAHFEDDCQADYSKYMAGDFRILSTCDALLMLPDWHKSPGANAEKEYAEYLGIPVYFYPNIPAPHPTELKRPQQSTMFLETVMRMYRVHLNKNADYSPANIMGTGEVGIMTRLWDKIARLMNLVGFRLEISEPAHYEVPDKPKNESLEDNIIDAAVYPIIWLIMRAGKWGR